jgi:hypothetical protein
MDWKDIQVVIPTINSMPERQESIDNIISKLYIDKKNINIAAQDKNNKDDRRKIFGCIKSILDGISSDWMLYFEDDVELSDNFNKLAANAISDVEKDTGVISFFSFNKKDIQLYKSGIRMYNANYPFYYAQCLAIRYEVVIAWKEMMLDWCNSSQFKYQDLCLGDCCKDINKNIMIYLPNLVQHKKLESSYGHTVHPISYTFNFSNKTI